MASLNSPPPPQAGGNALMAITDREFDQLRRLIHAKFGIHLTDQKRSLLIGRLQKLVRQTGFTDFADYYEYLVSDSSEQGLSDLVDRISTNHTYFNRENQHFSYFADQALPEIIRRLEQRKQRDLRIWCAGCSSGEEAYMLLMLMHERLGHDYTNWNAGILATDISSRVLNIARQGIYPEDRIAAIPDKLRQKYLNPTADGNWQFIPALRREATFRRFNLMNERFPFKAPFQIIFCRNVMIYFDRPTREALVQRFHHHTEPGGYLFIGHSESLGQRNGLYNYIMPATYRRAG
jgi:chemotaxis protein methyltransferase CheR